MKLDVTCMRYLTKDDYRILVAVEMGMRNHELVPVELIANIAKLRHGGIHKTLSTCLRYKLLAHANNEYNGYRLSYLGYDILALHTLLSRKVIVSVGHQIGVGKESDIFEALDEDGNEVVLKLHRLGRTSFRTVRKNRDYMQGKNKAGWLFMSRLAALKEFAFMKALYAHGFPTPVPFDQNRHIVAMSRVAGSPMSQLRAGGLNDAGRVFDSCLAILRRLAECGLIHCDFNEFNLMVDADGKVTLIDFPQIISTSHANAADMFRRDFNCIVKFFSMKQHYEIPEELQGLELEDIVRTDERIDDDVKASGFSPEEADEMSKYVLAQTGAMGEEEGEEEESDDEEEDEEEESDSDGIELKLKPAVETVFSMVATASALEGAGDATAEKGEDEEDGDDDEEGENEQLRLAIKERSKSAFNKSNPKGGRHGHQTRSGSRNLTKKINKYGRRVKADKLDDY